MPVFRRRNKCAESPACCCPVTIFLRSVAFIVSPRKGFMFRRLVWAMGPSCWLHWPYPPPPQAAGDIPRGAEGLRQAQGKLADAPLGERMVITGSLSRWVCSAVTRSAVPDQGLSPSDRCGSLTAVASRSGSRGQRIPYQPGPRTSLRRSGFRLWNRWLRKRFLKPTIAGNGRGTFH